MAENADVPMGNEELDARTWRGLEYLESISGPGAIAEMVGDYLRDVPGRMGRMRTALADGDLNALARLAHDLKSNSATLGVTRLSNLAARIEKAAAEEPLIDFDTLLDDVESQLPSILKILEDRARQYPEA